MRARIIRIGNSRGIRLPKTILAQCDLDDQVELSVRGRSLLVKSVRTARQGWEKSFRAMRLSGDDRLIDPSVSTTFDTAEWQW